MKKPVRKETKKPVRKAKRYDDGGSVFDPERIRQSRELLPPSLKGEEEGLEGVYPEAYLPVGRIGSGLRALADVAKGRFAGVSRALAPKTENSVYGLYPGASTEKAFVQRYVRSPEELQAIRDSGYMLPKAGGKNKKYFTAVDDVNTNMPEGTDVLRIARDRVKPDRAVSRHDVELFDRETQQFKKLKNGGTVKKANNTRGDGIAKRGKTKGTMR